ncbi:MAG TPA: Glu-tRNA(Gln) amidotransferase subunit GatE, partial [Candidatus Nanoarchaeia archaeon]|nr:Glu-tRNA(Gln) amidotransferase subunit GatE [Candidatus Nanoarchaeia archaeon]
MDYKSLGLKCGLEIHQQLDTAKLFCRCPSTLRDDKAHFAVTRMLRAVQGESGIIDIAALHEQKKGNVFVYEGHDTNCLVELDEEPPHALNSEALSAALEAALLLNAKVVDAIQVMRKTVVDGSNTSGFQRTALIAENGAIATDSGNVSIRTVCIEEDSARSVSTESGRITYRLDRLGTPLIEIATGAEIYSPKQCKEVAEYIGMILRSTGKVKRGIGTIRQDVNVSIARGARVEIKGAQELKMLPLLVENEAKRQLALLELHQGLKKREAVATSVLDCSELFKKTQSTLVKNALDKKQAVLGMKLAGCAGLIGKELLPGLRFGTELSDHAKMCGVGGIFHSDELPKYGITADEVAALRKKFGCRADDGFVIVVADAHRANRALDAVADRLNQAIHGVPEEVRRAEQDGT